MKNALIAAASVAALVSLSPAIASAQDSTSLTGVYANLGYANTKADSGFGGDVNLGTIQGRLGYRLNNYFGVEGELAGGVKSDDVNTTLSGVPVRGEAKIRHQEAIYAVGFAPVTPQVDLIGRIGYGNTSLKAKATAAGVSGSDAADGDSWNFGVGAQYHFDGVNGVRVDYTREEFREDDAGHADVWSIAYSRRF